MNVFGQSDSYTRKIQHLGFKIQSINGVKVITPPLCYIASGDFLMGCSPQRDPHILPSEEPEHWIRLDTYQCAKYPVTVGEYACFVENGGSPPETTNNVSWQAQLQHPDHPVVCVRWIDARAYTEWLRDLTGQAWRLPTEAEWEKAARWDAKKKESRIYPWGNKFDRKYCNTRVSNIGTTNTIDLYPQGKSPYEVCEMAGNIWEWTSSIFSSYPYDRSDGREDAGTDKHRVLRGGSWILTPEVARSACRNSEHPRNFVGHFIDVGFRLLLE